MAYIRAIASGNYSDPSTWSGGVVPSSGDYACTLNYRIVLDVDTDAHLCVNRTDWVAGGGTDSPTITGGFTLPADATRIVGGDIRYDRGTTSSRANSTTVPVYMTSGTLQVRNIVYVAGTNSFVASNSYFYVVYIYSTSGKTSKFTYTGTASVYVESSATYGAQYTYGIYAAGSGFIDLTFGEAILTSATGGTPTHSATLLYLINNSSGYTLTLNGNVPVTCTTDNNGFINIAATSSNKDNQKIIINSNIIGNNTAFSGTNVAISASASNNVSSITCTASKLSVHSNAVPAINMNGLTYGFTANDIEFFYHYGISLTATGNVTIGNVYINSLSSSYSNSPFSIAGTGNITMGDILLRAITSQLLSARTAKAVTITSTGNVVVGNISSEAGQLSEVGLLRISASGSLSTNITVGNIDLSDGYCRSTVTNAHPAVASSSLPVVYISRETTGTIMVGSVKGANNGLNVQSETYALVISGITSDNGDVTIEGNVEAGNYMSGVYVTSSTKNVVINGYVKGVTTKYGTGVNTPVAVTTYGTVYCDSIQQALNIYMPIIGRFFFNDYGTGSMTLVDKNNTIYPLYTVAPVELIIPAANDVRLGVNVGSGQGTLVIPQPATVQAGVVYDGTTTGTLSLASQADVTAIKAVTDNIIFDEANNVLAVATVDLSSITPRFNTIDAAQTTAQNSLNAANTAIAAIKSKTNQLTFTSGLVNANTPATDYTARFDTLEIMVRYIPTVYYTSHLNTIDATLDTIYGAVTAGGTDLTPVTKQLNTMQAMLNTVYNKAVQFTFTDNGVVADAETSVNQAINYDTRFDTIDAGIAGIRDKTDELKFDTVGVIASTTVNLAGYAGRFTDLMLRLDDIDSVLATISNATGAVDLEPISAALNLIYTSVRAIPRLTYGESFALVNAKLDAIPTEQATVDLTEVTDGIADVQTAVNAIPTTVYTSVLDSIIAKLNSLIANQNNVDFTTVLAAIESSRVLIAQVKSLVQSDSTDLTPVMTALDELLAKFAGVDAPVTVIPAGSAGTTTLYGYCYQANGVVLAGEEVTCAVTTACGTGKFVLPTTQTSTSDATGLVTFQVPRHDGLVVSISYGGNTEEVIITGLATQEMPAIVKS